MTPYQRRNQLLFSRTGGRVGLPIVLGDGSVFWSRGWAGCHHCHGDIEDPVMERFEERRNGFVTTGWRCVLLPIYDPALVRDGD